MNRSYVTTAIVLILIIIGIIFLVRNRVDTVPNDGNTPQMKMVTIPLTAQNNSAQGGTVTIIDTATGSKVSIDIRSGATGIAQPAHIHIGSCPTPGAILYPLMNVVNGKSETALNISVDEILADLPLAINVHLTQAQINTYVSCGNISATSTTVTSAY